MVTIKNWLNKYFGFTKREYNALLTLTVVLAIISVLPTLYNNFYPKPLPTMADFKALYRLQLTADKQSNYTHKYFNKFKEGQPSLPTTLFKFDPNTASMADWQKLGLSIKQAQSIVNYTQKGGKFYQPTDLQKMYTISQQKYQQLLPYVNIANLTATDKQAFAKTTYAKKQLIFIEINSADTAQLDQIKGIGAAFARRIANYRDKLGGFYKSEQLMEVYGLDSIKFAEIKSQINIDPSKIRQININTAQFEDLKNHPYLKYKQINAILQYRKQHGKYTGLADLRKVAILSPEIIEKLTPYLTF